MRYRKLVVSVSFAVLTALGLLVLIAYQIPHPPRPGPASSIPGQIVTHAPLAAASPATVRNTAVPGSIAAQESYPGPSDGRKRLEIHGRVLDISGRPIEGVLVAEERYFHNARSDREGRYRMRLDLPRHRFPSLHFLRNGYAGKLLRLGRDELAQRAVYELDVRLEEARDTVAINGWVGNEIGLGLEGARIELSASQAENRDSYYLTVFSDERGDFVFEGVRSGESYKLSVSLAPDYPYFEEPNFFVSPNPAHLDIRLRKLEFVDIDGMILGQDAAPVAGYEMYVSNVSTGGHSRKIVSDSSGYFSLPHFPLGEISLTTRGAEFLKITGMKITRTHYQNLQLTIDRGSRFLSGWISDINGIPVEKAMVTLDRRFSDSGIEQVSYRSQATDQNGAFVFAGLGGGEYRLTVYALGFRKLDLSHRLETPADELHIMLDSY